MIKAGILGGTGYAGQELIRLLYNHKEIKITKIMSESYAGKNFNYVYRNFMGFNKKICQEVDFNTIADDIDVLFTSLPYGVLMEHLTEEIMDKVKIIDIGVDYRFMNEEEYKKHYDKEHKSIQLASQFAYGLSEWNEEKIKASRHIANPGCFATAIELALLPLIKEDIIDKNIIVDGKCALSGAGKTLTTGTHFIEANESIKPYKIINHPHALESERAIEYLTDKKIKLTFVPHMIPIQRGMLVTCYTIPQIKVSYELIREIYDKYYKHKKFICILDKGMYVETKWVRNSNMCHINFEIDEENNNLIVFSAIDNLVKGAAGQAIQNMNMMFDFPENMALDYIPICI